MLRRIITTQHLIIIIQLTIVIASLKTEKKPVLITEIFRHGARSPLKNTLKIKEFEGLPEGSILDNGLRQHFVLGRQIAQNYSQIFESIKDPLRETKLYSSNMDRCIFSAQSHLLGLFPQGNGENITLKDKSVLDPPFEFFDVEQPISNFSIDGGYFPVTIHIYNSSKDVIFMEDIKQACPLFNANLTQIYLENVERFENKEETILQILNKRLKSEGFNSKEYFRTEEFTFLDIVDFWDSVTSYFYYFGNPFMKISDYLYSNITTLASINGALYFEPKYLKFYTTKIMEITLKEMGNVVKGSSTNFKYIGFSGRDTNIMPFLLGLKLTSIDCLKNGIYSGFEEKRCELTPDFSSNLIFELSQDEEDNFFVRIIYNGDPVKICKNREEYYCEYQEFIQYSRELLIDENFDNLCSVDAKDYKTVAYVIVDFILIGMIITFSVYISKNRSKIIKIRGVNRLVEVFSDNATMKNIIPGIRQGSFSDLEEIFEEDEEEEKEGFEDKREEDDFRFKSYGEKKEKKGSGEFDAKVFKRAMTGGRRSGNKERRFSVDDLF